MKKLILLTLAIVTISFMGCSSNNKSSSNKNGNNGSVVEQDSWATLDFHYRTGSVSPEYYYHYRIIINKDRSAQFIFYPSYADTGFNVQSYTISESQLNSVNDALTDSKVLAGDIPEAKEHPIGGSTQTISITMDQGANLDQMPKTITVPAFPEAQYEAGLEKLYTVIKSTLPSGVLDAEIKKKEDGN